MNRFSPDRPYLRKWLKRCARELSASGARTQLAHRLTRDFGGSVSEWDSLLLRILRGEEQPRPDLVTHLDQVWSAKPAIPRAQDAQGSLF